MSEKTNILAEASAAAMGSKASASSAVTAVGGVSSAAAFFSGVNWIGWISLAIAVMGLLINLYFNMKRDKREQEIHSLKVQEAERQLNAE